MQNYNAKLSDFGLARDGPTGDKSHVSTRVMGTRGYAAPEYLATGVNISGVCQIIFLMMFLGFPAPVFPLIKSAVLDLWLIDYIITYFVMVAFFF